MYLQYELLMESCTKHLFFTEALYDERVFNEAKL